MMESSPTTPESNAAARNVLVLFARVKGVSTIAIALLGAALGWFALARIAGAARRAEVDLSHVSILSQVAIDHPWIVCAPALGSMLCGAVMLRARGTVLVVAFLLAASLLLVLLAVVGITIIEVLAPMYQYQPIE